MNRLLIGFGVNVYYVEELSHRWTDGSVRDQDIQLTELFGSEVQQSPSLFPFGHVTRYTLDLAIGAQFSHSSVNVSLFAR